MHRTTTVRTIGLLSAVVITAALSLSSCSVSKDDDKSASDDSKSSKSDSDKAASDGGSSAKPSAAKELGDPVATRDATIDGQKVSLQVFAIQRSDNTAVLSFAMTVDPAATDKVGLYDVFGDENGDQGNSDSAASVDGVKLVDTKNSKLYLVASDGKGSCVCTNSFSGESADPGELVNMSATYAAPPADVSTVSVTIPKFGTFSGVAVQ